MSVEDPNRLPALGFLLAAPRWFGYLLADGMVESDHRNQTPAVDISFRRGGEVSGALETVEAKQRVWSPTGDLLNEFFGRIWTVPGSPVESPLLVGYTFLHGDGTMEISRGSTLDFWGVSLFGVVLECAGDSDPAPVANVERVWHLSPGFDPDHHALLYTLKHTEREESVYTWLTPRTPSNSWPPDSSPTGAD